jgi:hypothetical protein
VTSITFLPKKGSMRTKFRFISAVALIALGFGASTVANSTDNALAKKHHHHHAKKLPCYTGGGKGL